MSIRPYRLLYPLRTYLVTSGVYPGEYNVMTADWITVVSARPFYVAVSISPERYTYKLVKKYGELVVAVPGWELLEEVWEAGSLSGPAKLKKLKLTFERGVAVKSPVVKEAIANLECEVVDSKLYGDHELYISELVSPYYNPMAFNAEKIKPETKVILHVAGGRFMTNDSVIREL
ncbi:MAG: flavin reductase family protein [Thermogladius sp.]|nr:flavin reductase family protein [Thermogladius sp.]